MFYFAISAVALVGSAWYIIKDVPGGKVQKLNPNSFRFRPWDVA